MVYDVTLSLEPSQLGVRPDEIYWKDLFQAMVRRCRQFARKVNRQFKYLPLKNL